MDESKSKNVFNIFKLNKVIWLLTASDIFSWGIYLPLLSLIGLYLSKVLEVDTVEMVGIGVGLYYLSRSVSQIPIGLLVDKIKKDKDDLAVLTLGNILLGFPFLLFPLIRSADVFYILQLIMGLGASMNLVTWRKMFARNLDKDREGTSYAIYDTITSASIGVFSFIIGTIANIGQAYFDFVMIASGSVILMSSIWPAMILFVKDRKSNI